MVEGAVSLMGALDSVKLIYGGAAFVLVFVGERLFAAATPPKSRRRLLRNFGLWAIILAASPFIIAPLAAIGANQFLWTRPEVLREGWLVLAADIILLDLWVYCLHRAYHRIPVMWRFHKVHHFDEFLDSTSAFRFHLGEVAFSAFLRLIPVTMLAIPVAHILFFEAVFICAVIFHHSNLRLPAPFERALSTVIVTPSIHWVHHHAVVADTHSNYASIFSFWDLLFRSRSSTSRRYEMKIGVESVEDKSLLRLLLTPFMRSER